MRNGNNKASSDSNALPSNPFLEALSKYDLFDYQLEADASIEEELKHSGIAVLSICPGGGKTKTALKRCLRILANGGRALILAHGSNVLKSQWTDELIELDVPFTVDPSKQDQLLVSIPQAINKKLKNQEFDLLIVDEAHEFYYADMVQEILKNNTFKFQVLLTGTPSEFIYRGHRPIIIPGTKVFQKGRLADAYIGLVKSSYLIESKDYDHKTNDVKKEKVTNQKETEESLDALLDEMLLRLSQNAIKSSPNMINAAKFLPESAYQKFTTVFSELDKTMIAASNILQGKQILNYLLKNGVKAIMSDSKDDKDSANIAKFKSDPEIKVLITVKRGILGFNMLDLVNVVDFSCTRDIDRIYQLYARVLRKHNNVKKYFFRVVSKLNSNVDSYFTQAALCLNNEEFISKYNGKNLKQLDIIRVKGAQNATSESEDRTSKTRSSNPTSAKAHNLNEEFYKDIVSLGLMNELVMNKGSDSWKEFEYVNFSQAIGKLNGARFKGSLELSELISKRMNSYEPIATKFDFNDIVFYLESAYDSNSPNFNPDLVRKVAKKEPFLLFGIKEFLPDAMLSLLSGKYDSGDRFPYRGVPAAETAKEMLTNCLEKLDPTNEKFDLDLYKRAFAISSDKVNRHLIMVNKDVISPGGGQKIFGVSKKDISERLGRPLKSIQHDTIEKKFDYYASPFSKHWDRYTNTEVAKNSGYYDRPYMVYLAIFHWNEVSEYHLNYIKNASLEIFKKGVREEAMSEEEAVEFQMLKKYLDYFMFSRQYDRFYKAEILIALYEKFGSLYSSQHLKAQYENALWLIEQKNREFDWEDWGDDDKAA